MNDDDELFSYELRNELIDALEADPPEEEQYVNLTGGEESFSLTQLTQDTDLLAYARAGHLMAKKLVDGWSAEHLKLVTLFVDEMEKMSAEEKEAAQENPEAA